jgi:hypothetical protein
MLAAQMASFGDPNFRIFATPKALRAFNDREHKNCEISLPHPTRISDEGR